MRPLPFPVLAILPLIFFIPPVVSFAVDPGGVWAEYPGILFHLAMLLLISRMRAPEWARAAGYGWITIDVLTGVLVINAVSDDLTWAVRLGGHVLAGVWIVTAALLTRWLPIRIVGALCGSFLALYSFGSAFLPEQVLYPASPLMLTWLALLAIRPQDGGSQDSSSQDSSSQDGGGQDGGSSVGQVRVAEQAR
ncbi:hypothetical protein [Pseudosporangium ferrugineum]|uniref:Uncharacterized protein n=1 Tax=Pseudosporangium ferrugineum TaxID=439699 RepID=A0A2T0RQ58_9ACTN|nr:hypothetical protein [Pseudosporangium ferrugineum]PRY23326.1 hypothetical protein CLV70_11553 [Pseudosporangium ferrugineum]